MHEYADAFAAHVVKTCDLPEDEQKLGSKHVIAITNE